jgi:hypothetical protein
METTTEAIERLARAGFGADLVVEGDIVRAVGSGRTFDADDLAVAETVRIGGPGDPAADAIVFALTDRTGEPVGTLRMPSGAAAGAEGTQFVERLHRPPLDEADIRAHQEHDHVIAVFETRAGAEQAVVELRSIGLGSDLLGVAVSGPGNIAFEHDAEADLVHDVEVDAGAGAVVGFLAGFALIGLFVPVVGAIGVGGLLAVGAATGLGGALVGGYLGVANEEQALSVHEQIARTQLKPGQVLVAVCSHGHPDMTLQVLQRHGGDLRSAPTS